MPYTHINPEDRTAIATLLGEDRNYAYIGRRLGVDKATISREISRNGDKPKPRRKMRLAVPEILSIDGRHFRGSGFTKTKYQVRAEYDKQLARTKKVNEFYVASSANRRAKKRKAAANGLRQRIVHNSGSFLEQYILDKLINEQWSPEQIAGRLLKDCAIKISPDTIYGYVYNSGDKKKLVKHLRHHGNKYRRKHGTAARIKNHKSALPSIHTRDAIVESRTRFGDLEGDTVVGLDKKDRLLTHVDRSSGECYINLVLNYDSKKIAQKTIAFTNNSSSALHTITYDRGTEFADYEAIQQATNATIYFADAYSSHQRGTNENLNGLIRQYYPKRYDFKKITDSELHAVQQKLNNRPRKRYNYRTPIEQKEYLSNFANVALRV